MAYPTGIITRELVVGPAYDLTTGKPYGIRVLIEPSRILVYNGVPVLPKLSVFTFAPEEIGTIELPVCDQPGYTDSAGNLIDAGPGAFSHYYTIKTYYFFEGKKGSAVGSPVVKVDPQIKVALSTDDLSPIDIDSLVYFDSGTSAGIIYVPDSWTEQVENIPDLVDDTMDEWLAENDLPLVRADLNVLGWPEFIILEHDTDASSVPDGAFIVRLPEN